MQKNEPLSRSVSVERQKQGQRLKLPNRNNANSKKISVLRRREPQL
jgi:hypothetical protein